MGEVLAFGGRRAFKVGAGDRFVRRRHHAATIVRAVTLVFGPAKLTHAAVAVRVGCGVGSVGRWCRVYVRGLELGEDWALRLREGML